MITLYLLYVLKGLIWEALVQFTRSLFPHWPWDNLFVGIGVSAVAYILVTICMPLPPAGIAGLVILLVTLFVAQQYIPWDRIFK